jgi:hypothetical protein
MKRIRGFLASFISVIAISAIAAGSSAALPELGRCVKVPPGTGQYEVASCTGGAKLGGKYEWMPGAVKNKFVSGGGVSILETTGGFKITCAAIADEGEYVGPMSVFVPVVRLLGCEPAGGGVCENASAGEIVIPSHGVFGFIKNFVNSKGKLVVSVGVDLEPFEHTTVICEGPSVGAPILSLFGSVIAPVTPIDKMTGTFKLKFTASKGKQKPQNFETLPKDTLSLENVAKKVVEEAGITSTDSISNEEPLEIKAKP